MSKRLGIELAALRQSLWRKSGSQLPEASLLEDKPDDPTDVLRWIDTATMVADCLTKAMKDLALNLVLYSNTWSWQQTQDMKDIKTRKQMQRSTAKTIEDGEEEV